MLDQLGGKLDKQILKKFIEFECPRQIFISLGAGDPRWMRPARDVEVRRREGTSPQLLFDMGHQYEQEVYRRLLTASFAKNVVAASTLHNEVAQTDIRPANWQALSSIIKQEGHSQRLLLEHQWQVPTSFIQQFFGEHCEVVPAAYHVQGLRPDVTVLNRDGSARALTPSGAASVGPDDQRTALTFIDIKHSNPESIGKKHFIELLFYAWGMANYLHENQLEQLFYVALDGHGIWPQRDLHGLAFKELSATIDDAVVPMIWDDHAHLFQTLKHRITKLWRASPQAIEDVDVRIQPACSRCPYISDCKRSLGYEPNADLTEVDVRLLPYTSTAISEQLRTRGIYTVGELEQRQHELGEDLVPTPLYAERPLLKLKARALSSGERQLPQGFSDVELDHFSIALPQRCEAIITFNAEADPTNDRVFAVGVHLDIHAEATQPYAAVHNAFWAAFHDTDEPCSSPACIDRALQAIDSDVRAKLIDASKGDLNEASLTKIERSRLLEFARALTHLGSCGELTIARNETDGQYKCSHVFSFINRGLEDADERALAVAVVKTLHALFVLVTVYEEMVCVLRKTPWGDIEPAGAQSAAFYWSGDQLEHIQNLLERHLAFLLTSDETCKQFNELLLLLTPSESAVKSSYQHKKFIDVRSFVETTVGLPQIINYTWHEVAEQELYNGSNVYDRSFWVENFNYMDFLAWHEMLQTRDVSRASDLNREARLKAKTISELVRYFQVEAGSRGVLSRQARPIPSRQIPWKHGPVDRRFNAIARAWALYSKLSASIQNQQALLTRLTYPARSIGKLAAARVSHLFGTRDDGGRNQQFTFELQGISTNAKFGEGDYVLLVHSSIRDWAFGDSSPSCIIIDQMIWDGAKSVYKVEAHVWRDYYPHPYFDEERPLGPGVWFLYPRASDSWSGRLFENRDNLLARDDLGYSWLGERLAVKLGIERQNKPLLVPKDREVPLSQMYMYAPELLPGRLEPLEGTLLSQAAPSPDSYQDEAIRLALSSAVSCIQGPPGTGKSETIASLIDEFMLRRGDGRPARVLVTSFSYAPLFVVMRRIASHRDEWGHPTKGGQAPLLFFGSEERLPDIDGIRLIDANAWTVDGVKLDRRKKSSRGPGDWRARLEDLLGTEHYVLFANVHQLAKLGARTGKSAPSQMFKLLHNDFGFDLIVVDEASQMPVDGALACAGMVKRGQATLAFVDGKRSGDRLESAAHIEDVRAESFRDWQGNEFGQEELTKLVFVGDHNQLPPVRPVDPPEGLKPVLESAFGYYLEHLGVPSTQLAVNYRSREEIVAFTRHLALYPRFIEAFHTGEHAYPALPAPPGGKEDWIMALLSDESAVNAVVHTRTFEVAVSPVEALIVRDVVLGFYEQLGISTPEEEREFWSEHLGVVAPHNAQGRLVARELMLALKSVSLLPDNELEELLRSTIYSVEKFQGSARTFIIASMGISSPDQLRAEEAFIYNMNRLNVLTSRARQKMLIVCSQNFLDYLPRKSEVVPTAARARELALLYCNRGNQVQIVNEDNTLETIEVRWHDPSSFTGSAKLSPARTIGDGAKQTSVDHSIVKHDEETAIRALLETIGVDYDSLTPSQRAAFLNKMSES